MNEIDDSAWKRAREAKEGQIAAMISELQGAVAEAENDLRTLRDELERTRLLAKTAITILAETVTNHGALGPRSEINFSKNLVALIEDQELDIDRNALQTLKITATRRLP
ncbi:MAG TPA: hypothetical protein VGO55_04955 [Allosphingosinicella sp.]|nr:hypothetical protein [Allosphingosinicella sp.]